MIHKMEQNMVWTHALSQRSTSLLLWLCSASSIIFFIDLLKDIPTASWYREVRIKNNCTQEQSHVLCTLTRLAAAYLGVSAAAIFPVRFRINFDFAPSVVKVPAKTLRLSHYSLMLQLLAIIKNIIGVK